MTTAGSRPAGKPSGRKNRRVVSDKPLVTMLGLVTERQDADRSFRLTVPEFQLSAGDRVAIMGPSGSGKSTFIETLACARAPASAEIHMVNTDRGMVDVDAAWQGGREDILTGLRARNFGYVHQTGGLLEFLSVQENIALSQTLAGFNDPEWIRLLGQALQIDKLFRSAPSRLSGGQRQRVAIARALAHRPWLVIADEPTASLDRVTARQVMRLLCETTAATRAALFVATHDLALAEEFGFAISALVDDGSQGSVQAVALTAAVPANRAEHKS